MVLSLAQPFIEQDQCLMAWNALFLCFATGLSTGYMPCPVLY